MSNKVIGLEQSIEEEELVAELRLLGIRYLSRQVSYEATSVRPPEALLADLVRQPSARVRAAVIAVLLSHPEYADAIPAALARLGPDERLTLRSFYLAAMLLQREHEDRLRAFQVPQWRWLPELAQAMGDLGLPAEGAPGVKLAALGKEHQRRAKVTVNWTGTYQQVVDQLLRQWELESKWSR